MVMNYGSSWLGQLGPSVLGLAPIVGNVMCGVLILLSGWWISRRIAYSVGLGLKRLSVDALVASSLATASLWATRCVAITMMLGQFGIQMASIAAVFGAASLAVGLALQGTLQNTAAGLMLLLLRPFRVGDLIEVDSGICGTVRHVGVFSTEIARLDGVTVFVPNARLWGASIHNLTVGGRRRLDVSVGIGYADSISDARSVIEQVLSGESMLLTDTAPVVLVREYGDSAVVLTVRAWVHPKDFAVAGSRILELVKPALLEAGCSIPYPVREVRITSHVQGPPLPHIGERRERVHLEE
jgi:small conductance mechanosensitive channel